MLKSRTFTTASGVALTLHPVPSMGISRLNILWGKGRPKAPIVTSETGYQMDNSNDPDYLNALVIWEQEKNQSLANYVISVGIVDVPPVDFVAEQIEFFGEMTKAELKALWVSSLVAGDELTNLIQVLMGSAMPTDEGLKQAEATFRGDDRQPASTALVTATTESGTRASA